MKLLVLSDTHFEFHRDNGKHFINMLSKEADVCVIAGDLTNSTGITLALKKVCLYFEEKPVVYVNGNHDFYGSSREKVLRRITELKQTTSNLFFLDNEIAIIDGQRFLGTPLWFFNRPYNHIFQNQLNDFKAIKNYSTWVYKENNKAHKFLRQGMRANDIIISHHLPCFKSIPERYRTNDLNRFFWSDTSDIILDKEPKLWIHGHTHTPCDYILGDKTRIICNPLGYPFEDTGYTENLIIEV